MSTSPISLKNHPSTDGKKIAVGYCRVSTDEQAVNGLSIETQELMCRKAMTDDGYQILNVFKDEGKSGGTMHRFGIREIMRLVSAQEIQAVYSIHSDRIARNTLDYLQFRKLLREKAVILKCLYQPVSDDSAASRTMDTVMASFNEMQRLVTSEKVKATLYEKAKAGYFPSVPPPGYLNVDNPDRNTERIARKIVVIDPKTAPLVKEFFKLYSTGNFNVYDLCDIMHEKGLRSRGGGKMSKSRLYDLLRNRFYLGEVSWGPIRNKDGKHKPIVDEFLFNQVQQILTAHNHHACRRRKYQWLLNGFLYCYRHEKRYTAEWHLVKNKRIAYYHCSNRNGCGKYSEQVQLEEKIAEKFKTLEFSPEFVERVIGKAKEIFHGRRKDYDQKRQALINQRTAFDARRKVMEDKLFDGVISDEEFTERRKEIVEELQGIEGRLSDLERSREVKVDEAQEILRFTKDIHQAYRQASPTLKRHYLGFFWKKFEIGDGVIIKSHPTLLFDELLKLKQAFFKHEENTKAEIANVSSAVIIMNTELPGQDSNLRPIAYVLSIVTNGTDYIITVLI